MLVNWLDLCKESQVMLEFSFFFFYFFFMTAYHIQSLLSRF